MELSFIRGLTTLIKQSFTSYLGAIEFYTVIPIPPSWDRDHTRIARWAPGIGLGIGLMLGLADSILLQLKLPVLTRTVLVVASWIILTGGLHLDGVMDTADGLAVTDRSKRLEVMQDSHTGAFGVITCIILLVLKVTTLIELSEFRTWVLMAATAWGRWAQVCAIGFYPYLKAHGKGAFHKEYFKTPQDWLGGLLFLLIFSFVVGILVSWWLAILLTLAGAITALAIGYWFYQTLGGYTGDVYGAVVEWTEVTFLIIMLLGLIHLEGVIWLPLD